MKALSIRQPWAWLILNAGKDIENRVWRTGQRGRILVHAAKGMTWDEYENALIDSQCLALTRPEVPCVQFPEFEQLQRGGIVGAVDIIDCVDHSDSPWFCGPAGFVLANPQALPFHACKGSLGFFEVSEYSLP